MGDIRQQLKSVVVPLLVIALLFILLYLFIAALIDKLNSVNSDVSKAIIAGAATIIVAVVSLVLGKVWEQKIKIKQEVREKKIPVYEQQIETYFSTMFAEKCGDPKPTDQEIMKAIKTFTEKLIIWGGPNVIKAWSEFRLHDYQNSKPKAVFGRIETLMRAIRDDVGNSNKGLAYGDFIKLFVNDFGDSSPTKELESKARL